MKQLMIDFLGLYTTNFNLIDVKFILKNSKAVKTKTVNDESCKTGFVGNMSWLLNQHGLFVNGSPAKFVYGQNFKTLKHSDLDLFFDKLSDALHCDVRQMRVSRMDITDNLVMDHKPTVYKRYLGHCQYLPRVGDYEHNGLAYKNGNREVIFYDKHLETKNKKGKVPQGYEGINLLRFEYRLLSNINDYLGGRVITRVTDLLDRDVYLALIDAWEQMFQKIELVDVDALRHMPYNRRLAHDKHIVASGIMANGGLSVVLDDLKDQFEMKKISKRQLAYRKKKFTEAVEAYRIANELPSTLKEELVRKVQETAAENRALLN